MESLSLVGCTCALFPSLALNTITNQRRRDPPRSVASVSPVSAIKPTVAWNLFAFLNASITIPTSRLNCASIPSNAVWALNQKLISCDAAPEGTPLVSLVAAWMTSIHELTCEWRELWNALSVRCFDGMREMSVRWPCDWAFIQVSKTSSSEEGSTQQPVE